MALPDTIINKRAEKWQNCFYVAGVGAGLLSWGNFSHDAPGAGLLLAGGAVALFWIGSKIKTRYKKRAEKGLYW